MYPLVYSLTLLQLSTFCFYSLSMYRSSDLTSGQASLNAHLIRANAATQTYKIALFNELISLMRLSESLSVYPAIEWLLEKNRGLGIVHMSSFDGDQPIVLAISQGNNGLVQLLLGYGADVTSVNRVGYTPLHYAAANKKGTDEQRAALVKMLLDAGANPKSICKAGNTPLHIAVANNNCIAIIKILLEVDEASANRANNARNIPLHYAARENNMHVMQLLVDAGANTSCCNDAAMTPLDEGYEKHGEAFRQTMAFLKLLPHLRVQSD